MTMLPTLLATLAVAISTLALFEVRALRRTVRPTSPDRPIAARRVIRRSLPVSLTQARPRSLGKLPATKPELPHFVTGGRRS